MEQISKTRRELHRLAATELAFASHCHDLGSFRIDGDANDWTMVSIDWIPQGHPCQPEIRAIVADLSARYTLAPER